MSLLIDGIWHDQWYDTAASGGRFVRPSTTFRNWVTPDGAAGPTGAAGFAAAPGRYHLYVSLACPWAHRTLIMRALKGLEALVTISVVHWRMLERGWTFEDGPGVIPDPIHHADCLYQVYQAADPSYTGRVTTPVLWDRQTGTIEAGFATTQQAYDEAVAPLFETLDWLEARGRGYVQCHTRQAALLREPPHAESERDRAGRTGNRLRRAARPRALHTDVARRFIHLAAAHRKP
jgi:glutathionyl-hydroquinone reductase